MNKSKILQHLPNMTSSNNHDPNFNVLLSDKTILLTEPTPILANLNINLYF